MRFKLRGQKELQAQLRQIAKGSTAEFGRALYAEVKQVEFPETQKLVPVKTGDLKASGRVEGPEIKGKQITVRIIYDMPYAMIVHENLEAFHPNGQAKYVEQPLREAAPHLPSRVAKRISLKRASQQ